MNALSILFDRRFIIKKQNKELFYKVKDEIEPYKKFIRERLGYQLILNPHVIKLEKVPVQPEPWMGILELKDQTQYIFFCLILMFLEDKEVEEQFVLSSLTEFLQQNYTEGTLDWTLYQHRKNLVVVIKYCVSEGLIAITDGAVEEFGSDVEVEVLYENTGISRYYTRQFHRPIMDFTSIADFLEETESETLGALRRQRVFRKLLISPAVYRESEVDEDFNYIKNYRNAISDALHDVVQGELQVHKTSAYYILSTEDSMGITWPTESTLSDIVLLTLHEFYDYVQSGQWLVEVDESIHITDQQLTIAIESCINRYSAGFIKTYREMPTNRLVREIVDYLETFAYVQVEDGQATIKPIVRKIMGKYPEEFHAK